MKFNQRWLQEWVKSGLTHQALLEQITLAGLEVDANVPVCHPFNGVVVGEVVSCMPHPNADKLRVTQVNVGQTELLQIVCGAANCRQGLKVACAVEGAQLAADFTIKKTKLRGELSQGMLCSFDELGMKGVESAGIIELDQAAPVGVDLREYLRLDDYSVEIGLTPNRSDCLSIRGIARDVAALNSVEFSEPTVAVVNPTISSQQQVVLHEPAACPRYVARIIKNIDLKQTLPDYIKENLRRCGVRSIDPIVDITNYVMLEYGQPMHAFDANKIGQKIVVRYAQDKESLTLLDGNTIALNTETLVIADEHKALALAGIFGGKESAVGATTRDILLEAAYFDPLAIAGKARHYGLHTDASHRFERGVDPELARVAMEYATQLITQYCGGEVGPITEQVQPEYLPQRLATQVRQSKIDRLLGYAVPAEKITQIFKQLGCQVSHHAAEATWQLTAPSWRFDLSIEEDFIEEVARVYGYANLPQQPLSIDLSMQAVRTEHTRQNLAKALLVARGYHEVITYSFVSPKEQRLLHPEVTPLALPNPISTEMSVMRLSLWTGLLNTVQYNQNRQQQHLKFFEFGLRFIPDNAAPLQVRQEQVLSGVVIGDRYLEHWSLPSRKIDFYDIKGDLEALLTSLCPRINFTFVAAEHPALHPGQSAALYLADKLVGYIGMVHPNIEKAFDLQGNTILFELLWESLPQPELPVYQEVSRYPANRRDISLMVAEAVSAEQLVAECKRVGGEKLIDVNLFDVYRGKGVEEGYKSVAISLTVQDNTATLEEQEITSIVNRCVSALEVRFQVSLRD